MPELGYYIYYINKTQMHRQRWALWVRNYIEIYKKHEWVLFIQLISLPLKIEKRDKLGIISAMMNCGWDKNVHSIRNWHDLKDPLKKFVN